MPRTRPPPMSSGPQFPSGSSLGPCKAPLSVPEELGCPAVLTGITACAPLCPSPSHTWEELRTSPADGRLRRGVGRGGWGGGPRSDLPARGRGPCPPRRDERCAGRRRGGGGPGAGLGGNPAVGRWKVLEPGREFPDRKRRDARAGGRAASPVSPRARPPPSALRCARVGERLTRPGPAVRSKLLCAPARSRVLLI